jgi:hypothetical protein
MLNRSTGEITSSFFLKKICSMENNTFYFFDVKNRQNTEGPPFLQFNIWILMMQLTFYQLFSSQSH